VADDRLEQALDALLVSPAGAERPTDRTTIETVLTEGYARALELEAERARVARELCETALTAGDDGHPRVRRLRTMLAGLSERLTALRARLDEANRRHHASRKQHLDGRPGARGGADQEIAP
jgi:hypothetical protein